MRTISLAQADNFPESFYKTYSKFKHGSKTAARSLGFRIGQLCTFQANSTLVFFAAPYNNVETASHALKDYILKCQARYFLENNITIKQAKIHREYTYDADYGKLSAEERKAAINSDAMMMDTSCIGENDILVIVDDIKISGSHEVRIKEIISRYGIKNECVFVYLAEYTGTDMSIEHRLNHHSVKNLVDINRIMRDEEFILNIRVLKYILAAEEQDFLNFIAYQGKEFLEVIFSMSILNGYHKSDKYKNNFNHLKAQL